MPERIIKRPYPDAERISDLSHGTYGQCRAAVHGAVLFHAVFVGVGLEKPRPVLKEKTPARPEFFSFCRFRKYQRKGAALSHLAFQLHPGAQIGGAVLHDGEA